MSADVFKDVFERLGSFTHFRSDDEGRSEAPLLSSCFAQALSDKASRLLASAESGAPVLACHMSDGWGINMEQTVSVLGPNNTSFCRIVRTRQEFLAEKIVLRTSDAIALQTWPCVPVRGKTGWHVFSHAIRSCSFLRLSCPTSICISAYLQDGLHAAGTRRRMVARHELYYTTCAASSADARFEACQKDWVVALRCILHVASSAIKWSLSRHACETVVDDAHMTIKSLRNSTSGLYDLIRQHVISHVYYQDAEESTDARRSFWTMLGVSPTALDWVMLVDPRWDERGRRLRVAAELQWDVNAVDKIEAVILFS